MRYQNEATTNLVERMTNYPSAEDLLSLLKPFGACQHHACAGDNNGGDDGRHYCQAYVGPEFGHGGRILFVGLDHGMPERNDAPCLTLELRRGQILGYRDQRKYPDHKRNWNPHYQGCVIQAGRLLTLPCETQCTARCELRDSSECALLHFVQTNAIKSVPRNNQGMNFDQRNTIEDWMPELIEEIKVIKPSAVVLHGKDLHGVSSEATLEDGITNWFVGRLLDAGHICDRHGPHLWKIQWNLPDAREPFKSYLACFYHPSMGHHHRQWQPVIIPAFDEILRDPL